MAELSIKIRIGNREYPIKVKKGEEEQIRKAGKLLDGRIKNYQNQFGICDMQDLLAMAAFDCLVENLKREEVSETSDEFALREIARLGRVISDSR